MRTQFFNPCRTLAFAMFALLSITAQTFAGLTIDFDLRDQASVFDGNTDVDFANTGGAAGAGVLTATFQSFGGTLNSDASSFGIDGTGNTDDTDTIGGSEILEISFERAVTFTSLQLWSDEFTGSERFEITIGSNAPIEFLNANDDDVDLFTFDMNNEVLVGETVRLQAPSGGGDFGIQSFSVVPEPGCLGLIAFAVAGCLRRNGRA